MNGCTNAISSKIALIISDLKLMQRESMQGEGNRQVAKLW